MAVKAGEAFLELSVQDSKFRLGLTDAIKTLRTTAGAIAAIGAGMAAVGGAITAVFGTAIKSFANFGNQLDKMSNRTGIGVETLSRLSYAAEQSEVSLESLETTIKFMQKSLSGLGRGSKQAAQALAALGVDMRALRSLTPDEQLRVILSALANIGDASVRVGAAMAIFGRSGTQILPLIGNWKKLNAEAQHFGLTVSPEAAKRAEQLNSAFGLLGRTFGALQRAIGEAVSDNLAGTVRAIAEVVAQAIQWVRTNQHLLASLSTTGRVIAGVGISLLALSGVFPLIVPAAEGLVRVIRTLGTASLGLVKTVFALIGGALSSLLTPFGLVTAAVVAIAAAFIYFSGIGGQVVKFLSSKFAILSEIAGQTFSAIGDALAGGDIVAAANVLWAGLKLSWLKGTEELRVAWAEFKNDFIGIMTNLVFDVQAAWTTMAQAIKSVWAGLVVESKTIGEKIGHALSRSSDPATRAEQDKAHNIALEQIKREGTAKKANIESERQQALKAIEDARKTAEDAQKTQKDKDIAAAEGAIDKAQKEFDEARRRAAEARKKGFGGDLGDDKFKGEIAGIEAAAKGLTRFTFSGKLAPQVFGGGAESTAKQHLKVAKDTKKILEDIEKGLPFPQIKIGRI